MIAVSDFVEIPRDGMYPDIEGATHKIRYFRDGRKYGMTWRPQNPVTEARAIAVETGLLVQYCALSKDGDSWSYCAVSGDGDPWVSALPRSGP